MWWKSIFHSVDFYQAKNRHRALLFINNVGRLCKTYISAWWLWACCLSGQYSTGQSSSNNPLVVTLNHTCNRLPAPKWRTERTDGRIDGQAGSRERLYGMRYIIAKFVINKFQFVEEKYGINNFVIKWSHQNEFNCEISKYLLIISVDNWSVITD